MTERRYWVGENMPDRENIEREMLRALGEMVTDEPATRAAREIVACSAWAVDGGDLIPVAAGVAGPRPRIDADRIEVAAVAATAGERREFVRFRADVWVGGTDERPVVAVRRGSRVEREAQSGPFGPGA